MNRKNFAIFFSVMVVLFTVVISWMYTKNTEDENKKSDIVEFMSSEDVQVNSDDIKWTEREGLLWSSVAPEYMDMKKAVKFCNALKSRLPTISELRTLIKNCPATETNGECGVTDECLDASCVSKCVEQKNLCKLRADGYYSYFGDNGWFFSGSFVKNGKDEPWQVGFGTGVVTRGYQYGARMVRCVKETFKNRIVTEHKLSIWSERSPERISINDGEKYCHEMKTKTGVEWRLPTMAELIKRMGFEKYSNSCNSKRCIVRSEEQGFFYNHWIMTSGYKIEKNGKAPSFSGVIFRRTGDEPGSPDKGYVYCINKKEDSDEDEGYYCSDNDCPLLSINNWFFPPYIPPAAPVAVRAPYFTSVARDPINNGGPSDGDNIGSDGNTGAGEFVEIPPEVFLPQPVEIVNVPSVPIFITRPLH